MGSPSRECESSFEPKCPAADNMLARLPGALPWVYWGTDDYTGSRLNAVLLVLVLGLVSTTPGHFASIAVQGQIVNPPWGS